MNRPAPLDSPTPATAATGPTAGPAANPRPAARRRRPGPFPVTVTRIPGPATINPPPASARQRARHRHADRLANWIHQARACGEHDWRLASCLLPIGTVPQLRRVLDEAPQVAAGGDPWAVRTSRTPRGRLVAVRLHGPDWSLAFGVARPLPQPLLVIVDGLGEDGETYDWNMLDPAWIPELAAMNQAILAAFDPAAR